MTGPAAYYRDDLVTIYHGDCRDVLPELYPPMCTDGDAWAGSFGAGECVIVDPPWDDPGALSFVADTVSDDRESLLVFTDARRIGDPLTAFGAPAWLFVWDTLNTWSRTPTQPVQQTKLALWYGDRYDRDATLWGEAPPARDHPGTKQVPLDGRRLTDLYRESLRWLHNGSAGAGSAGVERFAANRAGDPYRHAKPVGWLSCLIGNTSSGPVIDPYCGSGSALVAARDLGRRAVGIDLDERCCEASALRLAQGVLDFGSAAAGPVEVELDFGGGQ